MVFHTHLKIRRHHGWIHGFIIHLLGMGVLSLALGYPLMLLWNSLVTVFFGLALMSYWQGVGIFLLARMLFGPLFPQYSPAPSLSEDDDWESQGGWGKWKYYNEYWKTEGKPAFDEFVRKRESEKDKDPR